MQKIKEAHKKDGTSYGIIFMDFSMPIMDGFEATEYIRSYYKKHNITQPLIIGCTGHSEEEFILKAWRYKFDEVIPKPINIEIIRQIFKEIIPSDHL